VESGRVEAPFSIVTSEFFSRPPPKSQFEHRLEEVSRRVPIATIFDQLNMPATPPDA
jgi:hypothetical protein